MSFRTTLVLLILAAALGGYVWFFGPGEPPDPNKAQETAVFDEKFEAKDVQKLDITMPEGKVTLERAGDSKWTLASPPGARADKLQADAVAETLSKLMATRKLDEPKNLGAFGLEKPGLKLDVQLQGKPAARTLLLGEKTVDSTSVYAKRADAAAVYLIPTTLQTQVSKKVDEWRDKALASVEFNAVTGVEVEREAGKLAFEKQGEGWMMTEPTKIPASKDEVEALIRETTGLRVETFVKDGAQPADLPAYGLDKPKVSVRLRVGGSASTQVLFGALEAKASPTPQAAAPTPHPGKVKATPVPPVPSPTVPSSEPVTPADKTEKLYAKLTDEASVVLVPSSLLPRLNKKAEEFYSLQPFVTQQWQVQRIELRLADLSLVLGKDEKSEWTVIEPSGKSVDYGKASTVLSDVFALRFEGVAPEGSKVEEKARIVVTGEKKGDAAAPAETLILGPKADDGTLLAQRLGEAWVYRLKDTGLDPVRDTVRDVLGLKPAPTAVPSPAAAAPPPPVGTPPSLAPNLAPSRPTPH
jgi:uncharacterized protein DUF4340